MVKAVKNFIFLSYGLFFFYSNVFSLRIRHKYVPNQEEINKYNMSREVFRVMRPRKDVTNQHNIRDGIDYEKKNLDALQEPSVPRPRQRIRGIRKRQSVYGRLFARRDDRATHAGYTNNLDTCKLYNKNLEKVWLTLSKFIGSGEETPDNMALHNIILLVKAYLDHHSLLVKNDEKSQQANVNQGKVSEILTGITEILDRRLYKKDEETPKKIIALIVSRLKTPKGKKYETCNKRNIDKLELKVKREYQKRIELSKCGMNMSDEKVNLERMSLREAKKILREWVEDPETKCITVAKNAFLEKLKAIINDYINGMQCFE